MTPTIAVTVAAHRVSELLNRYVTILSTQSTPGLSCLLQSLAEWRNPVTATVMNIEVPADRRKSMFPV